jgi:hypothetical protein
MRPLGAAGGHHLLDDLRPAVLRQGDKPGIEQCSSIKPSPVRDTLVVNRFVFLAAVSVAISTVLLGACGNGPQEGTSNLAAYCNSRNAAAHGFAEYHEPIVAMATFPAGTTSVETGRFQKRIGTDADNCFGVTVVLSHSTAPVLYVLASRDEKRLYQSFILQYLRKTRMFTSIEPGSGVWQPTVVSG